jgi:hypothetical protein
VKCRGLKAKLLVAKHIVRLSAPHACADVPDYEELTASGSAVGEVVDRHEPDSTVGIVDETQEITVAQGVPSR